MFAASLLVVALSAGVLLWIFARRSPRFGFARSAPAEEPVLGRTRRAGDGLVYRPPVDPAPAPVLVPQAPLGLSPYEEEEQAGEALEPEAELEAEDADFGSVAWDADLDDAEDEEAETSFAPEPAEPAASRDRARQPDFASAEEPEAPTALAAPAWEAAPAPQPEPEIEPEPLLAPAPRSRMASAVLGLTGGYDASVDEDEAETDYVPPVWQCEDEQAPAAPAPRRTPLSLGPDPLPQPEPDPEPVAAPADAGFDWPRTASMRLQELGTLLATGGFAGYFAEVRSPHAWDEMIEALRAVGAPEAAEIATTAGETQWPYHEQGKLAPAGEFAEADAQWTALDPDLYALLDAWFAGQVARA